MKIKIQQSNEEINSIGGISLIGGLFNNLKNMKKVDSMQMAKVKTGRISHSEILKSTAALFAIGKNDYADIELFRHDPDLREEMTISAVAGHLHLHWCTVKEIEKSHLQRKYKKIDLKGIESIGIDEVYIGKTHRFLTIVRDLLSGRVLFVGEGKSSDCLAPFTQKLKRAKVKLKFLAIDLGNAYASWIKKDFPDCEIVYDHFHLIKLMNDKLTDVRRKTMNKLEEDERKVLKGKRFTLVKNIENLDNKELSELDEIRSTFSELGEMSMMKECLRNIYGSQRQSVLCQLLKATGLWPTATLCENLMGCPEQWTASEPLEMDKEYGLITRLPRNNPS